MLDSEFQDKVIVVTGGSSGIGRHLCEAFTARGAKVAALARTAVRAAPDAALRIDTDVADEASVGAAVEEVGHALGRIDAVVNNAGIADECPLAEMSLADWSRVIETNLTGPFLVSRAAQPLLARARGSVVNISSVAAVKAMRGLGAYGAAKAGLLHLTKVMALEFARDGIRVNAIIPGYIRTPMNEAFLQSDAGARLTRSIPVLSAGEASDVEGAVAFLLGGASRYVTGTALTVDGGFLIK